ncbi:MAG: single-stranded-DNA-specific exonuclease RecJ [Candidatus Velamenicoccus archaeovorus]
MRKTWKIKEPDIVLKNSLSRDLPTSGLFAQILINRGLTDKAKAEAFLRSSLADLHDPFLMKGMKEAVGRLRQAVEKKEKVFIATDFDVDGVTSCTILESELQRLGVSVGHYLPHRVRDGYGLNPEAVEEAGVFGASVFVSLDCGITAFAEIDALNKRGIDAIIVDHHEPPADGRLPAALAIVNPKQGGCPYPFRDLASVGLAFKLVQALSAGDERQYLDLAALGTVADVVPLQGENRILVKHGLDALNNTKRHGLTSLMEAAGLDVQAKKLSTHSISFVLAPRLNASGRMDSAHASLDLLLTQDSREAQRLAGTLNDHNRMRQKTEEKVFQQAMDLIERDVDFDKDFIIVLCHEDWHPGVLGIVASKIVDRFYRPAVIISLQDDIGRGSARSVHNFHIYEALVQCASCLKEYGGHKYAAGLSLARQDIGKFKGLLNDIARESLGRERLAPVLEIDAQIPLSLVAKDLMRQIDFLSPYGEGNHRPVFASFNLLVKSKPVLVGKNSIKFWVSDGEVTYEAIGFGMGDFLGLVSASNRVDAAYSLGWDEWNPHTPLQLELKDLRPSS